MAEMNIVQAVDYTQQAIDFAQAVVNFHSKVASVLPSVRSVVGDDKRVLYEVVDVLLKHGVQDEPTASAIVSSSLEEILKQPHFFVKVDPTSSIWYVKGACGYMRALSLARLPYVEEISCKCLAVAVEKAFDPLSCIYELAIPIIRKSLQSKPALKPWLVDCDESMM